MLYWLGFATITVLAIQDIKRKQISVWFPIVISIGVLIVRLIQKDITCAGLLFACIPGGSILVLSRIWKGIGAGDGVVFLAIGCMLGGTMCIQLLFITLLLCMIAGIVAGVFFHKGKQYELPMVPFVALAFLLYRYCQNV